MIIKWLQISFICCFFPYRLSVFLQTPFTSQHSYLSVFHFLWKVTKDTRNSSFQNIKYLLVCGENLISRRPWYMYTQRDKEKKETQVELHFITVTLKQKNQRISPAAARRQTGEAWRGDNLNLHGCLHDATSVCQHQQHSQPLPHFPWIN